MEKRTGLDNSIPGYGLPNSGTIRSSVPDMEGLIQLGFSDQSSKPNWNSRGGFDGNRYIPSHESERFPVGYYIGISAAYLGLFLILILILFT